MKFYIVSPEVAGEIGDDSIVDMSTRPPRVDKLQYVFHGWMGDCIVESIATFVVTASVADEIRMSNLTGFEFDCVQVLLSEEFTELFPNQGVPNFFWLKVNGVVGVDDFSINGAVDLVVSDSALAIFVRHGLQYAEVREWRPG